MELSKLIKLYGDDEIRFQNLDSCFIEVSETKKFTKVSFGTMGVSITPNGLKELCLIVYMDRDKVNKLTSLDIEDKEDAEIECITKKKLHSIAENISKSWTKGYNELAFQIAEAIADAIESTQKKSL